MLSLDSLAVAPLSPVEVGDDWRFLDDDLEGTFNRRPFLEDDPSPADAISFSLELSWTSWGLSIRSRDISPFEVDDGIYTGSWDLACDHIGQHRGGTRGFDSQAVKRSARNG